MRPVLPLRFESVQVFRDTAAASSFLATDHDLARNNVVVKAIRKGSFAPDRETIIEHFAWHRGLRHPHIAGILDAGITPKGDLFSVRDFAPPTSLFTSRDMDLLNVLLGAIEFMHSVGRVHGSIKPSNVLASGKSVELADAWVPQPWKGPQSEEEVRFSAPEVLKGHPRTIESDLYSVGALLYRFFSGRDLFDDADLESLTDRYIWASPRPLTSISYVSRTISDIVEGLISKDPAPRRTAFESLKNELRVTPVAATRAPAVGMQENLVKAEQFLQQDSNRLRLLVIEAPIGLGKTRFIEELRHHMALQNPHLVFSLCPPLGRTPHATVARWILSLFHRHCSAPDAQAIQRLESFLGNTAANRGYARDGIYDDLIESIHLIAENVPLTLAVNCVNQASKDLRLLLNSLVLRGARLPIALIATDVPAISESESTEEYRWKSGARYITLESLNVKEIDALSSFLQTDSDKRLLAQKRAGGNPGYLEEYCKHQETTCPPVLRNMISKTLSALPQKTRLVAEILSLFEIPVSLDVVRRIASLPDETLRQQLSNLRVMGLTEQQDWMYHDDTRKLVHSRIPSRRRTQLHRLCYGALRAAGTKKEVARHAYLSGHFDVAKKLFCDLAQECFGKQEYQSTVTFYELAEACMARDSSTSGLEPAQIICLSKCRAFLGDSRTGRNALRSLLTQDSILEDPELVSATYAALASAFLEPSRTEAAGLLELAIAALPNDSPALAHRYGSLASAFILSGQFEDAERTLNRVLSLEAPGWNPDRVELLRTNLLLHSGRFSESANLLRQVRSKWPFAAFINSNLAVCLEHLGCIREARDCQLEVMRDVTAANTSIGQILCLCNLGSMETKLGKLRDAENRFHEASTKLEKIRRTQRLVFPLGSVYSDAALHWIWRGNFRKAGQCIEKLAGFNPFFAESFQFRLAQCEFLVATGQFGSATRQIEVAYREFGRCGVFFQTECLLIRARLDNPSAGLYSELTRALQSSIDLETRYQQCRILISLAKCSLSIGNLDDARSRATAAIKLATDGGFRLLAAETWMVMGLAGEQHGEKESAWLQCMQEVSSMGLFPLLAECSFHLGAWRYSCGDYLSARDHLYRSVAITTGISEELPARKRKRFLSLSQYRSAKQLLEESTIKTQRLVTGVKEPLGADDSFFRALYHLTSSASLVPQISAVVSTLIRTVEPCVPHPGAVVVKSSGQLLVYPINENDWETMRQRAATALGKSGGSIHFESRYLQDGTTSTIWIPFTSVSFQGGIYVEFRSAALDEREIQFLTMSATIAGAALDRTRQTPVVPTEETSKAIDSIVGSSAETRKIHAQIDIASRNSATVLIEGESGTGKELVARAIHVRSRRGKGAFVPVDCGALPDSLIEVELFGAKKGSYTGAVEDRTGLFEVADRGTVFLDEIANASAALQTRLLRVLQEREIRKVGDTRGKSIDIRLIAATNRNLEQLVTEGTFRQDLLFRLKVLHIQLPPLRARQNDISLLAHAFLDRLNGSNSLTKALDIDFLRELEGYEFPGNVRELQNIVERAFYSTTGNMIKSTTLQRNPIVNIDSVDTDDWFTDLTAGRRNFWSAIRDNYKRRDISRERVRALVDRGLRSTGGNYRAVASLFNLKETEYRRFMDFLRRNDCLLDFRPYRRSAEQS